nr:AP-3 complex subunit sigma-2-like isoform X1 [Macaca nemestrina]
MIQAILVFNNHGKPRLVRFYQRFPEEIQQQIVRETFHLVLKRDDNICNFLEGGSLIGGSDYKLIYRHYATLYFVFCVDSSESELGILDLIQVFVETLDKCFENVCELDLIFHMDKVHYLAVLFQTRVTRKPRALGIFSYLYTFILFLVFFTLKIVLEPVLFNRFNSLGFALFLLRSINSFNVHKIITRPISWFICSQTDFLI